MHAANRSYANPVHRGDYPDPSVIRVGDNEFWATTTSTEWAPQFPLLRSTDLINWKPVGAVFTERPSWSRGSFWAPEISQYRGRFYVYYVAEHVSGPLSIAVATADRPEGPYVDHGPLVGQSAGSIDPTPVTGEDGRRYLIWKEDGNSRGLPTTIWIQPLGDDGLRLAGDAKVILRNDVEWEGDVVEGPSVLRRGEWFYLFYSGNACCGKSCNYAVGVARARSVLGPWEKFAGNPILSSNADWRCPGHGSVFEASDGRTFYLYHAYSRRDSIYVGRQVLLDEVSWDAGGWPSINHGSGPSSSAPLPFDRRAPLRGGKHFFSAFLRGRLAPTWQWPQSHRPLLTFGKAWHRGVVVSCEGDCTDVICSVLARPTESSQYVAETAIDVRSLAGGAQASLCAYGDQENAVGAGVRDGEVVVFRRSRGRHRTIACVPVLKNATIRFRMEATAGYAFMFWMSIDGLRWTKLVESPVRAPHISPWDRGVRVALTVGGAQNASARFKWMRIRQTPEHPAVRKRTFAQPAPAVPQMAVR